MEAGNVVAGTHLAEAGDGDAVTVTISLDFFFGVEFAEIETSKR